MPTDWPALACIASLFLMFLLLPVKSDPSLSIVLSCLFGLYALRRRQVAHTLLKAPLFRVAVLAFALFFVATAFASVSEWDSLRQTPRLLMWGAAFACGAFASALWPEHGFHFFAATVFMLVLSLAFAAFFPGFDSPSLWQGPRLKLFAIHPSRLALFCAAGVFYTVHRVLTASTLRSGFFFFILAALLMYLIHLTNTRAVFFMVPVGLAMLVFSLPPARCKAFITTSLIILLLAGGLIYATRHSPHSARLVSVVTNITRDNTFQSRMPIWETGWEAFKAAPILGHGYRSFPQLYAARYATHAEEWTTRFGNHDNTAKNAHNLLLSRMVEGGTLGATGFALFFLTGTLAACKLPRRDRWILALPVFYLGIGLVDDTLQRANDVFILVTLGAAVGMQNFGGGETTKT